jgi:hypothetical protein
MEIHTLEDQLRWMEEEGFHESQISSFRKLKLSTIDKMTPQQKQLWVDYNGRVPGKQDARDCVGHIGWRVTCNGHKSVVLVLNRLLFYSGK